MQSIPAEPPKELFAEIREDYSGELVTRKLPKRTPDSPPWTTLSTIRSIVWGLFALYIILFAVLNVVSWLVGGSSNRVGMAYLEFAAGVGVGYMFCRAVDSMTRP